MATAGAGPVAVALKSWAPSRMVRPPCSTGTCTVCWATAGAVQSTASRTNRRAIMPASVADAVSESFAGPLSTPPPHVGRGEGNRWALLRRRRFLREGRDALNAIVERLSALGPHDLYVVQCAVD